jgi:hypothetical protein
MEQITIFDFIQQEKDTSCRWLKDGDDDLIGKVIPFRELKNMIGEKVIVNTVTSGYRIVRIFDYYENCNTIYKRVRPLPNSDIGYGEYVNEYTHDVVGIKECMACYEPFAVFDMVAYTDKDKSNAKSYVSEYYCTGGRWNMVSSGNETFHVLNA